MVTALWFVLSGMAITFATLVLLMLVMHGLNALLRPRSAQKGHVTKQGHA